MPSFSHILMLYPLSCKDILETTTLTLATSTPQQKHGAPFFCAMRKKREVRNASVACRSRRCHSSVTGIPEGLIVPSHDLKGKTHQGSMRSLPWSVKKHPGWNISENIGVMKNIHFFCKFCKVAKPSEFNFISEDGRVPEKPVFNQLGEMKPMSNLLHLSSFKVSFWAQTEPNSYLLLGERKPKVTCFYIHFSKTNEKQSNQKKDPKTLPLPYDIFHFPIFFTGISRNSRILSSQAADDLSCLFFLLIPEMMSSIPGSRLGALEKQRVTKRWMEWTWLPMLFTPSTRTNHGEWFFSKFIGYSTKMTKIFSSNIHNMSQVGSKHIFAHLLLLPNSHCIKDTKQHGRCFNGCPWTKNQTRCGQMQPDW